MDLFLAGCQGLGLALATGILAGAFAQRGSAGLFLGVLAAVGGALLFGASLTPEDHPAWPGWLIGAPVAYIAYTVSRDIAHSAGRRADTEGGGGVAFIIGVFAVVLAGLSLLPASPISLIVLAATLWLVIARRRKAGEKHAGLRSIR